jgi:hypothetical protein
VRVEELTGTGVEVSKNCWVAVGTGVEVTEGVIVDGSVGVLVGIMVEINVAVTKEVAVGMSSIEVVGEEGRMDMLVTVLNGG